MDNDPSARITRVAVPIASPGVCVICGTPSHDKGFADARLDFEFYGTVYLCESCVGEFARLFGYLSPDEFSSLRTQLDDANRSNAHMTKTVQSLESTVDKLISDADRRRRNVDDAPAPTEQPTVAVPSNSVDQPDAQPANVSAPEPVSEPVQDSNGVIEPSDEQGRSDVLDTSVADDLLGL